MNEIIQVTFRNTMKILRSEVEIMPLSRWNESVLRYYFCRALATSHLEVEQFVECDRIDLVLRRGKAIVFVEFKFYGRQRRFHPYDGSACGYKGGPGRQNLREFQACIDQLHNRRSTAHLSKYVVLVYGDPTDKSRARLRFADQYDEYQHPRSEVELKLLEAVGPFETAETLVCGRLYQIGDVLQTRSR